MPTRNASKLRRGLLATLAIVLVIATPLFLLERPRPLDAHPIDARTLAVLPLASSSVDAAFADGLHADLINAIADEMPPLRVIARTTMIGYRDRPPADAAEIARELDATHTLLGTLSRDAAGVRVMLELSNAVTGALVSSRTYERAAADAALLRADVAADVVARLSSTATATAAARAAPPRMANAAGYDAYLEALALRAAATTLDAPSSAALAAVEQALTAAIDADPDFAQAYAERAAIRLAQLANNVDTSEAQRQRIVDDLAAAERLAPRAPRTLAARAQYLLVVAPNPEAAFAAFVAAERAGLSDMHWFERTAALFIERGRVEEAQRFAEHALNSDRRSPIAAAGYARSLRAGGRAAEAHRVLTAALEYAPGDPVLIAERDALQFAYTGGATGLGAQRATSRDAGAGQFRAQLDALRYARRFDELDALLDTVTEPTLRSRFMGAGDEPLARYRGWATLQRGDRAAAAAEGRELLDFVDRSERTPRNDFLLQLLEAEGHLFIGDAAQALAAARRAYALREQAPARAALERAVAAVYAWAGEADAALDILERFAHKAPEVGPAEIAREPLYTQPLTGNARFDALVARLESRMRATTLE